MSCALHASRRWSNSCRGHTPFSRYQVHALLLNKVILSVQETNWGCVNIPLLAELPHMRDSNAYMILNYTSAPTQQTRIKGSKVKGTCDLTGNGREGLPNNRGELRASDWCSAWPGLCLCAIFSSDRKPRGLLSRE